MSSSSQEEHAPTGIPVGLKSDSKSASPASVMKQPMLGDEYVLVRRTPASSISMAASSNETTKQLLKSTRRSNERRGKGIGSLPKLPPPIMVTLGLNKRLRFSNTSAAKRTVTVADLLGALGTIGTVTNTDVVAFFSSVRVKSVDVWPSGNTTGNPQTATMTWSAGQSSQIPDEADDESIPSGVVVTRALRFTPPPMSLASDWITSADSSAAMFTIMSPTGSVIDLAVEARICDTVQPLQIAVATAVIGNIYYLALDGPANNVYVPTSLPTTH